MFDVNVGSWECRNGYRKQCFDSSDGVGSDGEVDVWLGSVGGGNGVVGVGYSVGEVRQKEEALGDGRSGVLVTGMRGVR